jgi:hypothetical protein
MSGLSENSVALYTYRINKRFLLYRVFSTEVGCGWLTHNQWQSPTNNPSCTIRAPKASFTPLRFDTTAACRPNPVIRIYYMFAIRYPVDEQIRVCRSTVFCINPIAEVYIRSWWNVTKKTKINMYKSWSRNYTFLNKIKNFRFYKIR